MRNYARLLSVLLVLVLALTPMLAQAAPASSPIITTATGYDSADDVQYVTSTVSGKNVIANWGARGEDCIFLTDYALDYYSESYDVLASYTGSTSTSDVPSSQMYSELQELMSSTHTFYTYYDGNKNVRDYYCYTDCVSNDTSQVSILYRGNMVTSTWNQGSIWNQEHVWPQSKLSNSKQIGDIMHLRPANPSENSSRGNTAYGESSGYYDPGVSIRGDCARMVLYMYVRWGVTGTMWGKNGVIENVDILLKWIEEDPVDTWEMGRNDSVQSITGVRNVFVDYPELAWLLFGKEVPSDMTTPSGNADKDSTGSDSTCTHPATELRNKQDASCTAGGYSGDTYCTVCKVLVRQGSALPSTGHTDANGDNLCDTCSTKINPDCEHRQTATRNKAAATCTTDGYSGDLYCEDCGNVLTTGKAVSATGHTDTNGDNLCDICSTNLNSGCEHRRVSAKDTVAATCTADGYSGDLYCEDCSSKLSTGTVIPATGHTDTNGDNLCNDCGADTSASTEDPSVPPTEGSVPPTEESVPPTSEGIITTVPATGPATVPSEDVPAMNTNDTDDSSVTIWFVIGAVILLAAGIAVYIIVKKKKTTEE